MNTRRDTITFQSNIRLRRPTRCCDCDVFIFLNMSVVQVVMRTDYIQQQNKLNAEIAMLEASYIEAQHTIASRIATLEGYDTDTALKFCLSPLKVVW